MLPLHVERIHTVLLDAAPQLAAFDYHDQALPCARTLMRDRTADPGQDLVAYNVNDVGAVEA